MKNLLGGVKTVDDVLIIAIKQSVLLSFYIVFFMYLTILCLNRFNWWYSYDGLECFLWSKENSLSLTPQLYTWMFLQKVEFFFIYFCIYSTAFKSIYSSRVRTSLVLSAFPLLRSKMLQPFENSSLMRRVGGKNDTFRPFLLWPVEAVTSYQVIIIFI